MENSPARNNTTKLSEERFPKVARINYFLNAISGSEIPPQIQQTNISAPEAATKGVL